MLTWIRERYEYGDRAWKVVTSVVCFFKGHTAPVEEGDEVPYCDRCFRSLP